ncbi:fimbrial protein [Morganella sp. B601]|uniref:fimbrial protein n=1 Tax=Morganella sp. B601 TaxID=3444315 RepID=UPI003EBDF6BE
MYQTLRTCCVLFTVICGGGLPGLATVAQAAGSADTTINFSATLVGGSCKVAVDNKDITFDPVSSAAVIAAGENGIDPRSFTLSFLGCNGWGLTPKIKISGTTITSGIPLFRTSDTESGYSQGYGVKLTQQGENTAISDQSVITLGEKTAQLNLLESKPLTFEARLSCGSCTPGTGLSGGNLKAAVTFQFLYE